MLEMVYPSWHSLKDTKPKLDKADIIKNLGIKPKDINDIVKDAQNAYKMVFEQVVLVMVQARYIIASYNFGPDFIGRLLLLDLLFNKKYKREGVDLPKIQENIIKMLEENKGSNDVISYLQSLETELSKDLLLGIQARKVVFSPVIRGTTLGIFENKKFYSYYQSYICLSYPLELFKKLLMVDYENRSSIENYIVQEVEAAVNKYDPFYPQNRNRLKASEIDDFNVLKKEGKLAEILTKYTSIKKTDILQSVRNHITTYLGSWASDIFAKISNPFYSEEAAKSIFDRRKNFKKMFDIKQDSEEIMIKLNKKPIDALHKLGQLDDFFNVLKVGLQDNLQAINNRKPYLLEPTISNENALSELGNWYESHATGILATKDSLPKIIASIINFDLYRNISDVTDALSDAELLQKSYEEAKKVSSASEKVSTKSTPVKDRNKKITYIISTNLYLDKNRDIGNGRTNFDDLLYFIKENKVEHINDLYIIPNKIMETWSIFTKNDDGILEASFSSKEQDRMMFRFKSIPIFFKEDTPEEGLYTFNQLISYQYSKVNNFPFPYMSVFPWPLWLENLEGSDTEIEDEATNEGKDDSNTEIDEANNEPIENDQQADSPM